MKGKAELKKKPLTKTEEAHAFLDSIIKRLGGRIAGLNKEIRLLREQRTLTGFIKSKLKE